VIINRFNKNGGLKCPQVGLNPGILNKTKQILYENDISGNCLDIIPVGTTIAGNITSLCI
jgi:hypothetical protein